MPFIKKHTRNYQKLSTDFIAGSEEELKAYRSSGEEEPMRQAAEKIWGSFVQFVKFMANKKSMKEPGTTRGIRFIADELARKTGDDDISYAYKIAFSLHNFFYEGGNYEEFAILASDNAKLMRKLWERYG